MRPRAARAFVISAPELVEDIGAIATTWAADEIVIGIPSADTDELRRIVESCESVCLPMKILPGLDAVLAGQASLNHIRSVTLGGLLPGRPILVR